MSFTTSNQEMVWVSFLQLGSPHQVIFTDNRAVRLKKNLEKEWNYFANNSIITMKFESQSAAVLHSIQSGDVKQ